MKYKNLEEALKMLRDRGKTVVECDGKCEVNNLGYYPDAIAYDEYNRLSVIVVDDSKDANADRVAALKTLADEGNILLIVIEAPSFMKKPKARKGYSDDLRPSFRDTPAVSGGVDTPRFPAITKQTDDEFKKKNKKKN